ncbi:MAG: hypothetical protein HZY75_05330 [Nocardioidaceae bacterium]|nr:MAG: hypothetical protein HZY75_05330 [Nocardioidaceae bacterium]
MPIVLVVLKTVLVAPAVLVSVLLWLLVFAVLPSGMGILGFLVGVATWMLLVVGTSEQLAVRVLVWARPTTAAEQIVLGGLMTHLRALEAAVGREVLVCRSVGTRTPPVRLVGRGALVMTPWMVEAIDRGWLTLEEATALVVHAEGRYQIERPPCEVAVLGLTLLWRLLAAFGRGIGSIGQRIPVVRFAWSARGVVGAVAVVQQVSEGRVILGVLAGTIVTSTYLLPTAERVKAAQVEAGADAIVVRHGLGSVLVDLLRRYQLPLSLERVQRLQAKSLDGDWMRHGTSLELVRS